MFHPSSYCIDTQNSHVWKKMPFTNHLVGYPCPTCPNLPGPRPDYPKINIHAMDALDLSQDERIRCTGMDSTTKVPSIVCMLLEATRKWRDKHLSAKLQWRIWVLEIEILVKFGQFPLPQKTNRKEADQLGEFGINGLWAQVISPQYTPFIGAG